MAVAQMAVVKTEKTAARRAPLSETSVIGWLHKNLFSSWLNTALTLISLYIIYAVVKWLWIWGVADAVWFAENFWASLRHHSGCTRKKNCQVSLGISSFRL